MQKKSNSLKNQLPSPRRELVIDRAKWLTGAALQYLDESVLLDEPSGMMCCLGFACKALGATDVQITGKATPEDVDGLKKQLLSAGLLVKVGRTHYTCTDNSGVSHEAMEANDDSRISNAKRELAVKRVLAKAGWDVRFIGNYPTEEELIKLADTN